MNFPTAPAAGLRRFLLFLVLSMLASASFAQSIVSIAPETTDTQFRPEVVYFIVELSEAATLNEHPDWGNFPQTLEHTYIQEPGPLASYPLNLADALPIQVPEPINADGSPGSAPSIFWRVPVGEFSFPQLWDQVDGGSVFDLWLVGSYQIVGSSATVLVENVGGKDKTPPYTPARIDLTGDSGTTLTGPSVATAPFTMTVTFGEAVNAGDFDATAVELTPGTATAADFLPSSGSSLTHTFLVSPASDGEVAVAVKAGALGGVAVARSNTVRIDYDTTPPEITSVTNELVSSPTNEAEFTLLVDATEPLNEETLRAAVNASITSTGGLNSQALTDGRDGSGRYIVLISSASGGDGTISFADLPAGEVTDVAGNPTTAAFTGMPAAVQVDRLAPSVSVDYTSVDGGNTIVSGSAISASEVTATFTFLEPVSGLEASDFAVAWSGDVAPAAGELLSVTGNSAVYRVGGIEGDGNLSIQLAAAAASDAAGNTSPADSLDLVISNTPIVADIRSTASVILSLPGVEVVDFVINWPKRVSTLALADLSIVPTGSVAVNDQFLEIVSQDDNVNRSIVNARLRAEIEGIGSLELRVAAGAVTDDYGNTSSVASVGTTQVNQAETTAGPFTFSGYDSIVMNAVAPGFAELSGTEIDFNGFKLTPRAGQTLATVQYDSQTGLLNFDGAMRLGSGGEVIAEAISAAQTLQLNILSVNSLILKDALFGFEVASGNIELLGAMRQLVAVEFSPDGMELTVAVRMAPGSTSIVLPGVTITQQSGGFVKTLPSTTRDKVLIIGEEWRDRAVSVALPIDAFTEVTGGYDLSLRTSSNSTLYDSGVVGQLTGTYALRADAFSFEDFVLTVAGFEFRPQFVTAFNGIASGFLRLSVVSYSGGGIKGDLNDIELRVGNELVGGDQLTLETTSLETLAELTGIRYQSDRIYTDSAQILVVDRGDPTRVEWLSDNPARVELPRAHVIPLGGRDGEVVDMRGPSGAYIDVDGYHALSLGVPSNFGLFSYMNVTIFNDGRTSTGLQVDGPSVGVDSGGFEFLIGGLPFANLSMPFRINTLFDQLRFTGNISLPGDFKLHTLLKADGVFARTDSEIPISADSLTSFDSCVPDEDGDAPIPSMNLASVPPFCLRYSNEPDERPTWQGSLKTKLPVRTSDGNVLELEGSGEIISGRWNRIQATIGGFEKPIGTTGAFLASLGGGLDNLARVESCWFDLALARRVCGVKPVTILGNAVITTGPEIKFIPEPTRLLQGPVDVKINDTRADAKGTLRLLDPEKGPELGDAFVNVTYSPLHFRAGSDVTGYPGVTGKTRVSGGTSAGGTLYASGESKWGLEIPDEVPLIGGLSIADVTMTLNTSPRVSMKGSFSVFSIGAFAVELTLEPSLTFSAKSTLRPWERELVYRVDANGKHQKVGEVDSGRPYYRLLGNFDSVSKAYRMPGSKAASVVELSDTAPTLIRVSYERTGVAADVEIFGPDGTRYAPSTVETDPRRAAPVGLLSNPVAGDVTFVFSAPKAGTYRVEIANPAELGEAAVEALVKNASPAFSFTQVASSGTQLELAWQAADADSDDADISLFIDQNRTGSDGFALELGRTIATGDSTVIDLSTLSLPPGNYWVYAQIDDAVNPPTTVYADSPVFIVNPDAPAGVRGVSVEIADTSALVSWVRSTDPTISGYSVKWTSELDDSFYGSAVSVEPDVETAFIEGLLPDTEYRFTVVAYRAGADVITRSTKFAAIAAAARGEPVDTSELSLGDFEQIAALSASLAQQAVPASEVAARLASSDSRGKGVFVQPPALIVEGAPFEIALATTQAIPFDNNPPRFLSDPPGVLEVDTALVYPVALADSDGDLVTLSLVTGPAGMQVVGNELRWGGTTESGFVAVELSATDGTDSTTQAWTLVVADAFEDRLRLSTAQPPIAVPGTQWQFAVAPQGGCDALISYELFNAPAGMTINANGQLQWSVPADAADDDLQLTVVANQTCEGTASSASQQYFVDVRPPQSSTLVSFPAGCAAPPTAVVTGPVALPDNGGLAMRVDMNGNGPWKLLWSDGVLAENISTSPYFRPVSESGDYTVLAFADAGCAGGSSDERTRYSVGGIVTGLKLPELVLELNEQQLLLFDGDGPYQFTPGLPYGEDYSVIAPLQPATHDCVIENASGTINAAEVSGVDVVCTSDVYFADDFEILLDEPVRLD